MESIEFVNMEDYIKHIDLQKFIQKYQISVPQNLSLKLDMQFDNYLREIIIRLVSECYGRKLEDKTVDVEFQEYSSWFEHFKDKCFPKWLKDKFPVKKTTIKKYVKFTASVEYPDLEFKGSGEPFIRVASMNLPDTIFYKPCSCQSNSHCEQLKGTPCTVCGRELL